MFLDADQRFFNQWGGSGTMVLVEPAAMHGVLMAVNRASVCRARC